MTTEYEDTASSREADSVETPEVPDADEPSQPTAWRRRTPRVFAIAATVIALGLVGTFLAPFVLPTYVVEGPLIQQLGPDEASIVWFASRADDAGMAVEVAGERFAAEREGRRAVARVRGLTPGRVERFTVVSGERTLARGALRGARLPGAEFSFLVFGDSGKSTRAQYNLAILMERERADFILHTGDLVYSRGARNRYRSRFFDPYAALLREMPFWPSLGNHDVSKPDFGGPYLDVFELPRNGPASEPLEHHYWFDYADARIVVIDTNRIESELRENVAPWIADVFAADAPRWRFALFHHPPYTGGKHTPSLKVQQALVPALERAGVQMVFNGHDHLYVRTRPILGGDVVEPGEGGVVYIVSGAGGAELYDALPPALWPGYVAVADSGQHSFTHVRVARNRLHLRQIGLDSSIIDDFELSLPRVPIAAAP